MPACSGSLLVGATLQQSVEAEAKMSHSLQERALVKVMFESVGRCSVDDWKQSRDNDQLWPSPPPVHW